MQKIESCKYTDVNKLVDDYNCACREVLDIHAPAIIKTCREKCQPGWYTDSVIQARRNRRKCERKYRKTKCEQHFTQYQASKKHVKETIVNAKSEFFKNKLMTCNAKDMYSTVNLLLNKQHKPLPDSKSPLHLANDFVGFFTSKIQKIRKNLDSNNDCSVGNVIVSKCNSNDDSNVQNDQPSDCYVSGVNTDISANNQLVKFRGVSVDEVLKLVKKSPNKSCVLDPLPTWLVKDHISVLLPTLSRIINMSLLSGTFPNILKKAVITPIIKKPSLNKDELKNYRPVANMHFTSKLLEKCVASQVSDYISANNLGEPMQSAYRAHHSTETALAKVHNDIQLAIDNQKIVLLLMLDLSAAFDTVDHGIFTHRLANEFGIIGTANKWFQTYLENRTMQVLVKGQLSDSIKMSFGLPQGSVIGPMGFVFYTSAVGDILRRHQLRYHLYADDIQVYTVVDPSIPGDVTCAMYKLTQCVNEIQEWMTRNKLKLNQEKTEFFIACSSNHSSKIDNVCLWIDNTRIPLSVSIRNLGVVFDRHMTMSEHVTQLSKSVNWSIRNIYRIRRFIDTDTCNHTVRSMILSKLDYCNILLNNITKKDLKRLQRLQNKCVRLIYQLTRSSHITPWLDKLHWLPVSERIIFKTLCYVFKSLHNLSPEYISNCIRIRSRPSAMTTRSSSTIMLEVPPSRKLAGDRSFSVASAQHWNKLPNSVKVAKDIDSFKSQLKTYLYPQ